MTKFETLLQLSEIKGAMLSAESAHVPYGMICELIHDLQDDDDDECPGCGCPSHDRCHVCRQFHD